MSVFFHCALQWRFDCRYRPAYFFFPVSEVSKIQSQGRSMRLIFSYMKFPEMTCSEGGNVWNARCYITHSIAFLAFMKPKTCQHILENFRFCPGLVADWWFAILDYCLPLPALFVRSLVYFHLIIYPTAQFENFCWSMGDVFNVWNLKSMPKIQFEAHLVCLYREDLWRWAVIILKLLQFQGIPFTKGTKLVRGAVG